MGSAPQYRQGIAAGVLATARSTGMVLGIGLAGAIFTTVLTQSLSATSLFAAIQASFLFASGISIAGIVTATIKE